MIKTISVSNKKSEKKSLLKGSAYLSMGAFLAKILGAIYRIPLLALIGGEGLGLYQMIFPVYTVLLDFSGAGVPNALSKLVAETNQEKSAYAYFLTAIKFFAIIGLIGALVMAVFSKPFSILQGNKKAYLGYIALSPAVFFVSLISCFRGFFQGKMNMLPTAISQIIEQAIKLVIGISLAYLFAHSLERAVAGATLAISISELVAFLYLFITLKRRGKNELKALPLSKLEFKSNLKKIISYAIPITLIGIILPASQIADSFLALNIMGKYTNNATALYGILSGVGMTIINLPVSICYGISTVAVPSVSKAKSNKDKELKARKTILLTFLVAFLATLVCYLGAPLIVKILFRSLKSSEYVVAVNVVKFLSPVVLTLSLIQTQNAVFIGKGRPYVPIVIMSVGVIIKILIEIVLYRLPKFNVYGGALGINACYFFVCLVNLFVMMRVGVKSASKKIKFSE